MAADQVKEPLYVVTAVNRLTGEREAVTRPHNRDTTATMLERLKRRQNSKSAYRLLRMKPAAEDGWIF